MSNGSTVIIGITGHWTVVYKATESRWSLIDSDGMKRMNKSDWTANLAEKYSNGVANEAWAICKS